MHTRRRFIAILAGAASLGAGHLRAEPLVVWHGVAMGARATLAFAHPRADRLIAMARAEIARLEALFSLHRADSALTELNREGFLADPAPEMLAILSLCRSIHDATGGAFDPTVQPLWALHAESFVAGRAPEEAEIMAARALVGFHRVAIASDRIAFARPGMALTLNGIAQGFVADRIAALLAGEGLTDALIDMGEIVGRGRTPEGAPWRVPVADPAGGPPKRRVDLCDTAIATSAPLGTTFDAPGREGHILDPRTGRPGGLWPQITVAAAHAALADGLSTAFCLMPRSAIDAALARFDGARLVTV